MAQPALAWLALLATAALWSCGCGNGAAVPEDADSTARYPVYVDGGWGYIDAEGDLVVEPRFAMAQPFLGDWALVSFPPPASGYESDDQALEGVIDPEGNVVWGPELLVWGKAVLPGLLVIDTGEELRSVSLDPMKDFILPDGLEDVQRFDGDQGFFGFPIEVYEELIPVKVGGRWGYANLKGEIIIDCEYESIEYFSKTSRVAPARLDEGESVIISTDGEPTSTKRFLGLTVFSEGRALATDQVGTWYLVDVRGQQVGEQTFSQMTLVSDGRLTAKDSESRRWGVYDRDLNVIVPPVEYEELGQYANGLASFIDADTQTVGYLDRDGKRIIELEWDGDSYVFLRPFDGALASVKLNGREGYINRSGRWVWREEQRQ